jgi:hypothetical protein
MKGKSIERRCGADDEHHQTPKNTAESPLDLLR